jgi:ligand-binding SRPBCC domain-containing protein
MTKFVRVSKIDAPCDKIWERAVTPEGINHELFPFMRMTVPHSMKGKRIHQVPLGAKLGRSWFLLFGFLPFDYDDITIAELDHGHRFLERSSMSSIDRWEHERTVTQKEDGCEVIDRISFRLKKPFSAVPLLERGIARMLQMLFAHRHRRLAKWFSSQQPR